MAIKIEIKHVSADQTLTFLVLFSSFLFYELETRIEIKHVSADQTHIVLQRAIKASLEPLAASGKFRWKLDFEIVVFSLSANIDFSDFDIGKLG